ncbi:MAG: hypothetical protein ACK5X8_18345 [Planctomyces sp.]
MLRVLCVVWCLVTFSGSLSPCVAAPQAPAKAATVPVEQYIRQNYIKQEHMIPMRDGVRLYTAVYLPKATDQK